MQSGEINFVAEVASQLSIPVFGSGDCVTPEQVVAALRKYIDVKKLYVVTAGDFAKQKEVKETKPQK